MGRTVPEGHLIMSGGSPPELRHTGAPSPCRVGALLATATIFKVTGHGPHQRRCCRPRSWPPTCVATRTCGAQCLRPTRPGPYYVTVFGEPGPATIVDCHAQMTMSGRVPTGIAGDGGALSMCSQGAPCHGIFFSFAWPPLPACGRLRSWLPCPGIVTPISGIQCLRPMRPTSCISMVLPCTKTCSSSK